MSNPTLALGPIAITANQSEMSGVNANTIRREDTLSEDRSHLESGKSPYLEETPGRGGENIPVQINNNLARNSSEKYIQAARSHRPPESPRTLLARELDENHGAEDEEQAQSARAPVLQLNRNLSKGAMSSAIVSYQVKTINLNAGNSSRIDGPNNAFTLPPSMRGESRLDQEDPLRHLRAPG